jgi:hypothetical protein
MVARTSTCLRRLAGGRRSGIVGFSRFLANPRVTVEALLDGWGAELSQGCAGRHILAIQDTSEFNFTTTKERSRGLGQIGKGSGRGVLLHAMLGVERQPPWPVPTTTLAGGAERKTGLPVWRVAPPA